MFSSVSIRVYFSTILSRFIVFVCVCVFYFFNLFSLRNRGVNQSSMLWLAPYATRAIGGNINKVHIMRSECYSGVIIFPPASANEPGAQPSLYDLQQLIIFEAIA